MKTKIITIAWAVSIALGITLTTGCATVTSGTTQKLQITAKHGNKTIDNVTCTIQNSKGNWTLNSSHTITIPRDSEALDVVCISENKKYSGTATIMPSYNKNNLWNIALLPLGIVPGVVGFAADASTDAQSKYPNSVNVTMQIIN